MAITKKSSCDKDLMLNELKSQLKVSAKVVHCNNTMNTIKTWIKSQWRHLISSLKINGTLDTVTFLGLFKNGNFVSFIV